jgi:hypothetical protein
MTTAFEIDDVVMTYQPSRIVVREAEGIYQQYPGGGYTVTDRPEGRIVEVEWGTEAAREAVLTELRTKRGATYLHEIAFVDPVGTTIRLDVLIPPISFDVIQTEALGAVRLMMREAVA